MPVIIEVTTTCSCQASASQLADRIIEARLAACVQISGPIQSRYRWQGSLHQDEEWVCTIKSTPNALQMLTNFIETQHAYELPQILITQVEASERYAAWVESEVAI